MSFNNPGFSSNGGNLGALSTDPEPDNDKEKKVTRKVVNKQIIIAGVFAIVVALAAGMLLLGSSGGTWTVVAKQPINAGTQVTNAQVAAISVPPDQVVTGALTGSNADDAMAKATEFFNSGARTKQEIVTNQQLSTDQFGAGQLLATDLAPNERLVSTSAVVANAVAGNISAGDFVDVIGTVDGVTGVIASHVPVVAATVSQDKFDAIAGKQADSAKDVDPDTLLPGKPVPGIYVLRTSSADAIKIVAASETGKINLLWQGPNGAAIAAGESVITGRTAVCGTGATCN